MIESSNQLRNLQPLYDEALRPQFHMSQMRGWNKDAQRAVFQPVILAGMMMIAISLSVAGAITAGGCLGILIPPSVLLIVYGAVAGVSVVQLYAGAFLPGIMLAGLYIGYIIVLAKWKPALMPPPRSERLFLSSSSRVRLRKSTNHSKVNKP